MKVVIEKARGESASFTSTSIELKLYKIYIEEIRRKIRANTDKLYMPKPSGKVIRA